MAKTGSHFWLGFIIGLLAALLIAAVAVLLMPRLRPIVSDSATPAPSDQVALPVLDTLENDTPDTTTSTSTTNPVTPQTAENIRVTDPLDNGIIDNPVVIRGEARVFENTVSLRVRDGDGRVLAETFTTANSADIGLFGPFSISVTYEDPDYSYGSIEVYEESARDGSEINKVVIPVNFE